MSARAVMYPAFAADSFVDIRDRYVPDVQFWSTSGGKWSIGDAERNYGWLQQIAVTGSAMCLSRNSISECTAQAVMRAVTLQTDSARVPGLLFRYQSPSSYYRLSLRTSNVRSDLVLQCYLNGSLSYAATTSAGVSANGWYLLKARSYGNTVIGSVNDQWSLTYSSAPLYYGRVGFETDRCHAQFRDFLIYDESEHVDLLVTGNTPAGSPRPWGGGGERQASMQCKVLGGMSTVEDMHSFLEERLLTAGPVAVLSPAGTYSGYITNINDGVRKNSSANVADINVTIAIKDVR